MGTTAAQKLKIIYNSITFGTGNEDTYRIKDGTFEYTASEFIGTVSFNVVVFATSYSDLVTKTTALENTLRERRKGLAITIDSNAWYTFAAGGTINKDQKASFTQLNNELHTGRSQEYQINIEVDLPPVGRTNGRTEGTVNLHYKPNRERILTITAQYNATSGTSAYSHFGADTAYWVAVQDFFNSGDTWKLISEDVNSPDPVNDTHFEVTRVYEDLIEKIKIEYDTFTMGPTGAYRIIDGWSFNRVRVLEGTVSFRVRVYGADAAALTITCSALEEAMAERRKALKITYDGSLQRDFTTSTTFVDQVGQSTSEQGEWFGSLTRDYSVTVVVDLPPLNSDGITEKAVSLSYSPSRRVRIEIAAQYNATSASSAKTLMDANFDTYCASVFTSFGETLSSFNIIDESHSSVPVIDNQIEIRRVYEEVLFSETSSALNDTDIIGMTISLEIGKNYPGDFQESAPTAGSGTSVVPGASVAGAVKRLIDIRLTASMAILESVDIMTKYNSSLRDYLIDYAKTASGVAIIALVREAPTPSEAESTLAISMEFKGAIDGAGQVISSKLETEISLDDGKLLVGAWDATKFGKYEVDVKAIRERTITTETETVAGDREPPIHEPKARTTGARWVRKGISDRHSYITLGNPDNGNENFDIATLIETTKQEWITDPVATVITLAGR